MYCSDRATGHAPAAAAAQGSRGPVNGRTRDPSPAAPGRRTDLVCSEARTPTVHRKDFPVPPVSRLLAAPRATAFFLLALLLAGCASTGTQQVPPYGRLVADLQAGHSDAWDQLDTAFLRLPDFQDRLERLGVLHDNIDSISDTDAAALTRTADEMLDLYYGDLRAHELRQRLALATGDEDEAAFHDKAGDAIAAAIAASGDGSAEHPYHVLSAPQAYAWLQKRRVEIVGALYAADDDAPSLMLVLKTRTGEGKRLEEMRFDLTPTFRAGAAIAAAIAGAPAKPSQVVVTRATQGDSAAQTAYAMRLWHEGPRYAARAIQWLQSASDSGNVIAREMLGVIYGSLASGRSDKEADKLRDAAVDQFLLAVNQGSDTAMYNLAQLYLSGQFGEENQPSGVALLQQAAARDNADALVMLARLNYNGQFVPQDREHAVELLKKAAGMGQTEAQLFYARHLLGTDDGAGFDDEALKWLTEAATSGGSPDAMMLLATLYAKGEHVPVDIPQAIDWMHKATAASDDPEIINSVAWIMAVAENHALRDPDRAVALMDKLMKGNDEAADNPAYIDTWAAANAASGDFDRALALQKHAVELAESRKDDDGNPPAYLDVLREHLDLFGKRGTVTEDVP